MAIKRKTTGESGPLSDPERDRKERDIPSEEKAAVKLVLAQIDRAKTLSKTFNETTLPALRRKVAGTTSAESDKTDIRTNLIFATQATLLPHTYAKNPEISVTPSESVKDGEYTQIKDFCTAAQIFVNKMLVQEAKLKLRVKSGIRSTMSTGVGWFKLSYQHSLTHGDPVILRRANDTQDNLNRVEYEIHAAEATTDIEKLNEHREALKLQMQSLMERDEVRIYKGFALDRVMTEDILILDESIREFDEYVDSKKIAHRIWFTDEDYAATFGMPVPTGAVRYSQPAASSSAMQQQVAPKDGEVIYRAVYEIWDKTNNLVYCVTEGSEGYTRKPYSITGSPERWYGFYALGFNLVEGRFRPISDVELLQQLQDEYNTTRYLYAEARKEAIPVRMFRKTGGLTPEDIQLLVDRKARDWIGVEGNPTTPLAQDILQLDGVKIDPTAYDVTLIRNDMDMMVGLSDASRSNLIEAKTATEAEIMKQALMTRVAERQDTVEDMVGDMATAVIQIGLQVFSKAEIAQLCGEGAGEVWPENVHIEEIFRKVRVQVKAGSSGKPNIMKERESWAAVMPVIQKTAEQVAQFRMAGQYDLAEASVELLKETLRRYDEKIEVEKFIPKQEVGPDGQPLNDPRNQAMAELQQAKEQMALMQEEMQKLQQEYQQCQMDLKVAKQAEQARIAEAEAKSRVDVAREEAKAQREEAMMRQKHEMDMSAAERKDAQAHEMSMAQEETRAMDAEAKEYAALVAAAAKLVEAQMQPQDAPAGEGEAKAKPKKISPVKPSIDAAYIREAAHYLGELTSVLAAVKQTSHEIVRGPDGLPVRLVPEAGHDVPPPPSAPDGTGVISQMMAQAVLAIHDMAQKITASRITPKRVELDERGLPIRLVEDGGPVQAPQKPVEPDTEQLAKEMIANIQNMARGVADLQQGA